MGGLRNGFDLAVAPVVLRDNDATVEASDAATAPVAAVAPEFLYPLRFTYGGGAVAWESGRCGKTAADSASRYGGAGCSTDAMLGCDPTL